MEKMITQLNEFLSDLEMFNIKLQNYHWNVVGKGFFTTHEKLEEYYNEIREQIDEIAEHILILGYQPVGTMKEFIENSSIQEGGQSLCQGGGQDGKRAVHRQDPRVPKEVRRGRGC